jgi:hypothetical protein
LHVVDRSVINPLIETAVRLSSSFNSQEAANCLWALSVLQIVSAPLISPLCGLVSAIQATDIEEVRQVLQCHELFSHFSPPISVLDESGLARFKSILSLYPPPLRISDGQRQVCETLRRLGYECELEVPRLGGLLSIDILARDSNTGKTFAVEFDGPSHYLRSISTTESPSPRNDGSTVLRNNLIRVASVLKLIIIPYFDWYAASKSGHDGQEAYIKDLLPRHFE